jgi:hypothetical protein
MAFFPSCGTQILLCSVPKLKARGPPADDDDSLAAHLLRIRDPGTGQLLSDDWLLPQISVMFWAGFDTTGNTMAWTLYCISQHPEVLSTILKAARFGACLCHIPSLCMSTHVMHACLIRQFGAHKLLCLRCASLIYGLEVIYEPPLLPPPLLSMGCKHTP